VKKLKWFLCIIFLCGVGIFLLRASYPIKPNGTLTPIPSKQVATSTESIATSSPEYIKNYVYQESKKVGVNPVISLWILDKESQNGQRMTGDDGMSRGYFMIDRKYHPEVSDACAMDLKCSLQFALNLIKSGQINQFSTYKFCRKFYPDCPF